MAQSHAIIEQYSESESSIEDNPVLGPESEIVIPLRAPQDQGKIKEKVYEQGDRISARLRGIPGNLGGFFFRNNPQPPPRAGKVSKPSKTSKAGKNSKTKSLSEQLHKVYSSASYLFFVKIAYKPHQAEGGQSVTYLGTQAL